MFTSYHKTHMLETTLEFLGDDHEISEAIRLSAEQFEGERQLEAVRWGTRHSHEIAVLAGQFQTLTGQLQKELHERAAALAKELD